MTTKNREESQPVRNHTESGVTLIEMMVTLTLTAILMALAIPGLTDFVLNARRDSHVFDIVAGLNLARSEAIKRNSRVTLCPSAGGQQCNSDTHWETGWIVFHDPNSNGTVDSDETILRVQQPKGGEGTVRGSRNRLTYQSYGFSTGFTDTLRICDQRGVASARSVVLSNMGRARIASGANSCP
jgi:type IV fimbrial biogenesis protein FimT